MINLDRLQVADYTLSEEDESFLYQLTGGAYPETGRAKALLKALKGEYFPPVGFDMATLYENGESESEETVHDDMLKVNPNPADDYVRVNIVSVDDLNFQANLRMFNGQGKEVKNVEVENNQRNLILNIEDLPVGLYYIVLEMNGKSEVVKFIIQK